MDTRSAPLVWPTKRLELPFDWREQDRRLGLPDDQVVRRLADRIERLHKDQHDQSAAWRKDVNRQIGLFGERAFARIFRLPMDTTLKKWGTGRANFLLADGTPVDVITRQMLPNGDYPDLTMRARGRPVKAKVLVLIIWDGLEFEPVFAGWKDTKIVRTQGMETEFQPGMPTYYLPYHLLEPMWLLMARHRSHDPLARPESWTPLPAPAIQTSGWNW